MSQPPKILLLFAHPEPHDSVANQLLLQTARNAGHVTVHDLYAHYPDFFIDIHREQQLLCEHQLIVFQHPLYTYSCPALLKEWMDRVLTRGFASGAGGNALVGKSWRTVVTTGETAEAYQPTGVNRYTIAEVLRPFEMTARRCRMRWLAPLVVYSARRQVTEALQTHARNYGAWLAAPLPDGER